MDSDNQKRTEELSSKVNRLKHLTLDMDKEMKDQNRLLGNMGFDFDSTGSLLKSGANRVVGIFESNRNNRRFLFYFVLCIVVGFFVLYKLFTKVNL